MDKKSATPKIVLTAADPELGLDLDAEPAWDADADAQPSWDGDLEVSFDVDLDPGYDLSQEVEAYDDGDGGGYDPDGPPRPAPLAKGRSGRR